MSGIKHDAPLRLSLRIDFSARRCPMLNEAVRNRTERRFDSRLVRQGTACFHGK
jgi:hypothetical protein